MKKTERYVVTIQLYVSGNDDDDARMNAKAICDQLNEEYDNGASVTEIVKQAFGKLGNEPVKTT